MENMEPEGFLSTIPIRITELLTVVVDKPIVNRTCKDDNFVIEHISIEAITSITNHVISVQWLNRLVTH